MKKYILLGTIAVSIFPNFGHAAAGEEVGTASRQEGASIARQHRVVADENLLSDVTGVTATDKKDKTNTIFPMQYYTPVLEETEEDDRKTPLAPPALDTMFGPFDLRDLFHTFDDWSPDNQKIKMKGLKEALEKEGIVVEDLPEIKKKQDEYRSARSFETGELYVEKDQEYLDLVNEIIPYWRLEHPLKTEEKD